MLADSDLIVLDEPFKGLDPDTKSSVLSYVQSKAQGKTLLVVTHDAAEAAALAPADSWIRMPVLSQD
ncbi:MAG: hypothetical protein LRY35_04680 [Clostridiales bacterium]|nr:hypothetical protein [Clostridiales bacterium]